MANQFKKRMTKSAFEQRIATDLGIDNVSCRPYEEMTDVEGVTAKMTLYYKNGVHIGTWQSGQGWLFESAYI